MGIRDRLVDFGRKHGFIPKSRENLSDDFAYTDPNIRELTYQARDEIDDYYLQNEGVRPFHWHKIKVYLANLPSRLEYIVDQGRKVLKKIGGYLGQYATERGDIYINKYLLELDDGGELAKTAVKHELMHSIQDELGILKSRPRWEYEAEASMVSVDDFENVDFQTTSKPFGYMCWTLRYIGQRGKKLMSSFRDRIRRVYDYYYFTEEELQEI
jgi:hypothetical protein